MMFTARLAAGACRCSASLPSSVGSLLLDLAGGGGGSRGLAHVCRSFVSRTEHIVASEPDGEVDRMALLFLFTLLVFALRGGRESSPELASLKHTSIKVLPFPSFVIPVVWSEEQARGSTCYPLRLSDNGGEGTRLIPSEPGLGPPSSPEPVTFFCFIVLSIIIICF